MMGPEEDPANVQAPLAAGGEGAEEARTPVSDAPTGAVQAPVGGAVQAGSQPTTANMLPGRERRRSGLERIVVRVIATCGVVAIGVALGAILAASKVQGWITGLVVALVSVVLSAVLWSSQRL